MAKISKRDEWFKYYIDRNGPGFLNATKSAKLAGYKANSENAFACIGHQNYRKLQNRFQKWVDKEGLTESYLKALLFEGLHCMETKFFSYEGKITEIREVIPWGERRRFLELAMRLKGMLTEKIELTNAATLAEEIVKARQRLKKLKDGGK